MTALMTQAGRTALLTPPLALHQAPPLAVGAADAADVAGTAVAASVWQSAAAQAGLHWVTAWQGQWWVGTSAAPPNVQMQEGHLGGLARGEVWGCGG